MRIVGHPKIKPLVAALGMSLGVSIGFVLGWAQPLHAATGLRPVALMVAPAAPAAPVESAATRADGQGWRIELREQASARGAWVTLDDVAVIRTADATSLTRLMGLSLAASPRLSTGTVIVSRQDLQRLLAPLAADAGVPLAIGGASRAVVDRAGQSLPGSLVADAARRALADALGAGADPLALEPARIPRDLELPGGVVTLSPRATHLPRDARSRASVWIDVIVDGRLHTAVSVDFAIAAVDRPAIRPAAPLRTAVVAPVVAGDSARTDAHAAALHATATGPSSQVPQPLVTRGMQVTLRGGNGPVRIEQAVQVLENGGEGQIVKVKAAGATEPVLARVVSPTLVESTE